MANNDRPQDLAARIQDELSPLLHQPLKEWHRAANMAVLGFGPTVTTHGLRGNPVQRARYRLHLQCPWRLVSYASILFGSGDLNLPADSQIASPEFHDQLHSSQLDTTLQEWMQSHASDPPCVTSVAADSWGGLVLDFSCNAKLQVLPCGRATMRSKHEISRELWRFFGHREDEGHLVVDDCGIVPDEDS